MIGRSLLGLPKTERHDVTQNLSAFEVHFRGFSRGPSQSQADKNVHHIVRFPLDNILPICRRK